MMKFVAATVCLALAASSLPSRVDARGALFPTYHPKPCSGEDCRADDARSGEPCTGLLCSFASAHAMWPPVTASQAAEAAKAQAQSDVTATILPAPSAAPAKSKHERAAAKARPAPSEPAPTKAAAK